MSDLDVYGVYRSSIRPCGRERVIRPSPECTGYDLMHHTAAARETARWLLLAGDLSREDARLVRRLKLQIDKGLAAGRRSFELTACERFSRRFVSKVLSDAPAKAAPGLARQLEALQRLAAAYGPMPRAATDAALRIREHMQLYAEAWKAFGKVQQFFLNGKRPEQGSVMEAAREVERYRAAFKGVVLPPFRRDAALAVGHLQRAGAACRIFDHVTARRHLVLLRQGFRWVFLRHHLQTDIVTPLSFLLARAVGGMRREGLPPARRLAVYREFEPQRFAAVRRRLEAFDARLERCADEPLEVPAKARVRAGIERAKVLMDAYAWPAATRELVRTARLL